MDNQTYMDRIAELQKEYFGKEITADELKQINKEQEKKLTKARSKYYEFVEHMNDKYKNIFKKMKEYDVLEKITKDPKQKKNFLNRKI